MFWYVYQKAGNHMQNFARWWEGACFLTFHGWFSTFSYSCFLTFHGWTFHFVLLLFLHFPWLELQEAYDHTFLGARAKLSTSFLHFHMPKGHIPKSQNKKNLETINEHLVANERGIIKLYIALLDQSEIEYTYGLTSDRSRVSMDPHG